MTRAFTMFFAASARRLRRDERGAVAIIWALSAMAVLALVGVSLDFSRANAARQSLQNAADGAALVAERMGDLPFAERRAAAEQYFRASIADMPYAASATISIEEMSGGGHRASASMPAPTSLSRLVSDRDWVVNTSAEAKQEGSDLEVSLVLDITGSMGGSRITDLRTAANDLVNIVVREEQEPYYSKVALVPYSIGVNLGANAATARGAIVGPTNISAADWRDGAPKNISGASRANPVVITSNGHGLANGDTVRITGVNGMTQVNNRTFTVANRTANTFQLSGVNGGAFNNYSSGGAIQKCFDSTCAVRVTSADHGLENNDYVFITGVNGMTQINRTGNNSWQVSGVTEDTFLLRTTTGPTYGAYTNGGQAFCLEEGCEYYRFTNASNTVRILQISTCVSERIGPNAYRDVSPQTTPVGRNYHSTGNPCPAAQLTPLTSDKEELRDQIDGLQVTGSTAGQIGIAWGWYMLSPNFANLWTPSGRPKAYGSPNLKKIAVLMTDGEFNTPYCSGVIARDAGAGSGSASDHHSCNATNGNPFGQATQLCTAMKNAGVTVYTVGFGITAGGNADRVLSDCASGSSNYFLASNGTELREAFRGIATAISQLRLSK
jgi:Flp pilus assembly protein TadG